MNSGDGGAPPTVWIFGLGLMGGSLARDLSLAGYQVFGTDLDPASIADAQASEIIQGTPPAGSLERGIVVLAAPVDACIPLLADLRDRLGAEVAITDLGSTKTQICQTAEDFGLGDRFVGSHPLTGHHASGWSASREGLYRDAEVFLCASDRPTPETRQSVRQMWEDVGARISFLDPIDHDRRMAWVSHLPQISVSLLASTLATNGFTRHQLGPGGRDATRLAASSPEVWTAIVRSNAAHVQEALAALERQLDGFRQALERGDFETISALFEASADWS